MSDFVRGVIVGGLLVAAMLLAAQALAAPQDHVNSWTEAVNVGAIDGDAAYYYNGEATPAEYAHAVITALLTNRWVPPPAHATESDPATFCADQLWEYRSEPGAGYWPQTFASDSDRYDSLTVFDDFYGPVTYLWPTAGRVYEHPAGGYDRLVVCWTDTA